MSLISMGQLDEEGCSTTFGKGGLEITKDPLVLAKSFKTRTSYTMRETTKKSDATFVVKE